MTDELISDIKDLLRLNDIEFHSDRLTLDYIKVIIKRYEKQMND